MAVQQVLVDEKTRLASLPTHPKLALFSFFSGAGFLDLGFEDAGFSIKFANELHGPFVEAYQYSRKKLHRGELLVDERDIQSYLCSHAKSMLASHLKEERHFVDLVGFVGGPPCPDFSVGGKNRGKYGDNGRLSATYIDIIIQAQPDFFVFENVKGLLRTKKHRAFYEELKQNLVTAKYELTDKLVNCIYFGAPQDRERIFLIGIKKSVFRDLGHKPGTLWRQFPWFSRAPFADRDFRNFPWPGSEPFIADSVKLCPNGIPKELTVNYWFDKNLVDSHPNSVHCFRPKAGLKRFLSVDEGDDSRKSFKRLHRWRYSPTACYGNNEVHLHPYKARRISVAEAMAIQSLPPKYSLPPTMTLSNMFKTVGNGVPYLTAKSIALTLKAFLTP